MTIHLIVYWKIIIKSKCYFITNNIIFKKWRKRLWHLNLIEITFSQRIQKCVCENIALTAGKP